jgi:hypothetical protein
MNIVKHTSKSGKTVTTYEAHEVIYDAGKLYVSDAKYQQTILKTGKAVILDAEGVNVLQELTLS